MSKQRKCQSCLKNYLPQIQKYDIEEFQNLTNNTTLDKELIDNKFRHYIKYKGDEKHFLCEVYETIKSNDKLKDIYDDFRIELFDNVSARLINDIFKQNIIFDYKFGRNLFNMLVPINWIITRYRDVNIAKLFKEKKYSYSFANGLLDNIQINQTFSDNYIYKENLNKLYESEINIIKSEFEENKKFRKAVEEERSMIDYYINELICILNNAIYNMSFDQIAYLIDSGVLVACNDTKTYKFNFGPFQKVFDFVTSKIVSQAQTVDNFNNKAAKELFETIERHVSYGDENNRFFCIYDKYYTDDEGFCGECVINVIRQLINDGILGLSDTRLYFIENRHEIKSRMRENAEFKKLKIILIVLGVLTIIASIILKTKLLLYAYFIYLFYHIIQRIIKRKR